MTKNSSNKFKTIDFPFSVKWIGFVCLITITVLCFTIGKCPTNSQILTIYLLTALCFSFLLPRSVDKSKFTYKVSQLAFDLTGGAAFFAIIICINPIDKFKSNECISKYTTVTVFVYGKYGKQDMILRNKGDVVMDIGDERKTSSININGEAFFPNIIVGDSVRLNISFSEPYFSCNPDSIYVISSDSKIYLPVYLKGVNKITGHILFQNSPLAGVNVELNTLRTTSDSAGYYLLNIPDSLQTSEYEVWFTKKGFQSEYALATPETGQPLNIVMTR